MQYLGAVVFKKTIKRISIGIAGCIICVAVLQAGFFAWIWTSAKPLHKADVIIVFPGDEERTIKGHALARDGYADNLLIIGQTEKSFPELVRKLGALPSVNLIANGKSRSTFEDINLAQRIIRERGFKSVVLVTATYHMPRTLFLFKAFLDADLSVDLQYYPVELKDMDDRHKEFQLYCNEMIKFWGSTAEMIGYRMTNTLLRDSPFFAGIGRFVKKTLLFQV